MFFYKFFIIVKKLNDRFAPPPQENLHPSCPMSIDDHSPVVTYVQGFQP